MQEAKYISLLGLFFISTQALSFPLSDGHFIIQGGGFVSNPGKAQDINIRHIRGDRYIVNSRKNINGLVGLGYLAEAFKSEHMKMLLGVDAFYLAKTSVTGDIVQEHHFANLAYQYNITHLPVYALAKAVMKKNSDKYFFTVDAGVGPNFNKTTNYRSWAINASNAIPDYAYSGDSNTALSATAGIGIIINKVFGERPLECGYRFFYLGHGNFNKRNDQWLNTLDTGNVYAQALMCGVAL